MRTSISRGQHGADNRNQRVWQVVQGIPAGRVVTYGAVAAMAGVHGPTAARQVGYALAALASGSAIPWHRVVNATGHCSRRGDPSAAVRQQALLAAEGVVFGAAGEIDLDRYRWQPAGRTRR